MSRPAGVLLAALLVLSTFVGVAAAETRTGGTIVVGEGQTVDGDLTAFGGTVVVRGTVNGDLEAFAGSVVVTGTVDGDVEAFAGSVRVAGEVTGDVDAFGGDVDVESGAEVGGSLAAAGGSVVLDGTVLGDARVGAETFALGPEARVGGDLEYDAETTSFADGAVVEGATRQVDDVLQGPTPPVVPRLPGWVSAVYGFLVNLLVGVLLLAVAPAFSRAAADRASEEPLTSAGVGLLVLVGVPVALVLVALTIIGIPVAVVGGLLFGLAAWVGYVLGTYAVGVWALSYAEGRSSRWLALLVGLLAVSLVGLVPVLGGLVQLVVLLLGLGALSVGVWRRFRREREEGGPVAGDEHGPDATVTEGTQPGSTSGDSPE